MVDFILAPLVSLSLSPLVWRVLRNKIPTLLAQVADTGDLLQGFLACLRIAPKTV